MEETKELLNTSYIEEFVGIAGTDPFKSALELFQTGVVEYLDGCRACFAKHEYEDAGKELHKLKGAASSIGLQRLMVEAKVAELKLLADRENYALDTEVAKLKDMAEQDVEALEKYIAQL